MAVQAPGRIFERGQRQSGLQATVHPLTSGHTGDPSTQLGKDLAGQIAGPRMGGASGRSPSLIAHLAQVRRDFGPLDSAVADGSTKIGPWATAITRPLRICWPKTAVSVKLVSNSQPPRRLLVSLRDGVRTSTSNFSPARMPGRRNPRTTTNAVFGDAKIALGLATSRRFNSASIAARCVDGGGSSPVPGKPVTNATFSTFM